MTGVREILRRNYFSPVARGNVLRSVGVINRMSPNMHSLPSVRCGLSRRAPVSLLAFSGIGVALMILSGCVVVAKPRRAPVPPPPPQTVVIAEPARAPQTVIIIHEAPPAPRREVIVERDRPSHAHVWIAGHWRHDGRVYLWVPGHWAVPPQVRAVWAEPRWELRGGAYIFIEGVWR